MGRGRAKAKQTKVARQLKYHSPDMDLESLQRELASEPTVNTENESIEDQYAEWADYFESQDSDETEK